MSRGRLIAFEGIDGTGKSTQVQLLAAFLRERGHRVVTTFEPTDSVYGRRIRELYADRSSCTPEEELELFLRDRRLHVDKVIAPGLAAGRIVLTDRYYYSTVAYQGVAGMDVASIFSRNSFAPRPDLVILLRLDPFASVERIRQGRGEKLNDFEQPDRLRRVAALFDSFADPCICRIAADRTVKQVAEKVRQAVLPLFSRD